MAMANPTRGVLPRIGISALNVLLPGLGLVRLARYRLAVIFFLITVASIIVVIGGYLLIEDMRFSEWAGLVGAAGALALVAYLGSIATSSRASKEVEPRAGLAWRWYGILAILAFSTVVSSPLLAIAHTRYHPFYIPTSSMLPTMHVDDRFLADMHAIDPIERGDLVIVHANGEDWVRRVTGLPGDRIAMARGMVILNGKSVVPQLVEKTRINTDWGDEEATILREQFPGETKPHLVLDTGPSPMDDSTQITLPPGRYFVLGDDRDHSADSRLPPGIEGGLGLVARDAITGRIAFRYWRKGVGVGPADD